MTYTTGQECQLKGKLADFIVKRPKDDSLIVPMEVEEELSDPWTLFTNGSSCVDGSGAGLILTNLEGTKFTYTLRFGFDATNNEVEYEALIAGLRIAEQIGISNLQTHVALGGQLSQRVLHSQRISFAHLTKQVLVEVLKEKSINEAEVLTILEEEGDIWMTPIYEYLTEETRLMEKKKARTVRLKSRRPLQANYVMRGIHDGSCSMHAGPRTINGEAQLHALVDGKEIIIIESSVRRDLRLADEEGVDCLPNSTIFKQLTLMGKPKRKDTQVPHPSDPIENVPDEALHEELGGGPWCQETMGDTTTQTRFKSVSKHFNDSLSVRGNTLRSDEDSLKLDELMALCTTLQNKVLVLEQTMNTQHNEMASLKKRSRSLKRRIDEEITLDNVHDEVVEVINTAKLIIDVAQDSAAGDIVEHVKPMKRKDQIKLDEEAALKLQAAFDEEERIAKERERES
uniref:Reverse transcriptase domain-containing protein n=1 Tax=Tanacetum cinerariifolium TaxID=118510 RepID=A0A6L2KIF3_TANCI|nr:hypothetical protein [Tanacetum cinerariifolium]